jgi:hypothetical protein
LVFDEISTFAATFVGVFCLLWAPLLRRAKKMMMMTTVMFDDGDGMVLFFVSRERSSSSTTTSEARRRGRRFSIGGNNAHIKSSAHTHFVRVKSAVYSCY